MSLLLLKQSIAFTAVGGSSCSGFDKPGRFSWNESGILLCSSAAVPKRAAEPAGERPAVRGGAHQAVQQHPGDRAPAHLPVEPGHAARAAQGQGGPGIAGPHAPVRRLQDGQLCSKTEFLAFWGGDDSDGRLCWWF